MEQEQKEVSTTSSPQERAAKPEVGKLSATPAKAQTGKPVKNLYEPYKTPPVLYHAIRLFALGIFLLTTRLRLVGRDNVPRKGPFILVANHLSWVDVPMVPAVMSSKVVYMAKEELFKGKVGWLVRFLGAFPVKRGEGDRQALRTADEQLKAGNILVIFPEGTRSKTHMLSKAHSGMGLIALRSGVPVVPAAISGSEKALKKFWPLVTITYGEPMVLKPKGQKITRADIEDATTAVMQKISDMLPPEYRGVYAEKLVSEE